MKTLVVLVLCVWVTVNGNPVAKEAVDVKTSGKFLLKEDNVPELPQPGRPMQGKPSSVKDLIKFFEQKNEETSSQPGSLNLTRRPSKPTPRASLKPLAPTPGERVKVVQATTPGPQKSQLTVSLKPAIKTVASPTEPAKVAQATITGPQKSQLTVSLKPAVKPIAPTATEPVKTVQATTPGTQKSLLTISLKPAIKPLVPNPTDPANVVQATTPVAQKSQLTVSLEPAITPVTPTAGEPVKAVQGTTPGPPKKLLAISLRPAIKPVVPNPTEPGKVVQATTPGTEKSQLTVSLKPAINPVPVKPNAPTKDPFDDYIILDFDELTKPFTAPKSAPTPKSRVVSSSPAPALKNEDDKNKVTLTPKFVAVTSTGPQKSHLKVSLKPTAKPVAKQGPVKPDIPTKDPFDDFIILDIDELTKPVASPKDASAPKSVVATDSQASAPRRKKKVVETSRVTAATSAVSSLRTDTKESAAANIADLPKDLKSLATNAPQPIDKTANPRKSGANEDPIPSSPALKSDPKKDTELDPTASPRKKGNTNKPDHMTQTSTDEPKTKLKKKAGFFSRMFGKTSTE